MRVLLRPREAVGVAVASVLAVACLSPIASFAESFTACSSIASGLWSGVNMVLGTNHDCQGNPAGSEGYAQASGEGNVPIILTGEYVALGDSVAAGLGLPPAADGTSSACGVSSEAYPTYVATDLHMPYRNLACSGATAGDLVTDQGLSGTDAENPPQLDTAFASGSPSLITITAGANDVYWSNFLKQCYVSTCGGSTDQATFSTLRTVLQAKLAFALSDINYRSNGNPPPVVVTGYYQPLADACAGAQSKLTAAEISWIRAQTNALNQTIADVAADYSFVHYAPVDFTGHELCTGEPWVQGPADAAPFHPTAQGQQAIANAVLSHMR